MNFQETAVNGLKNARKLFTTDLEALPEEAYFKNFGPKTRTVADIVYEVNLVNDHIGMVIRGEKPFDWPEGDWIKAPDTFTSKEIVLNAFKKSMDHIVSTAENLGPDDFDIPIATDEGETTRFERCRFMIVHLWYHLGQLNFIQTMIGDDTWHWH